MGLSNRPRSHYPEVTSEEDKVLITLTLDVEEAIDFERCLDFPHDDGFRREVRHAIQLVERTTNEWRT